MVKIRRFFRQEIEATDVTRNGKIRALRVVRVAEKSFQTLMFEITKAYMHFYSEGKLGVREEIDEMCNYICGTISSLKAKFMLDIRMFVRDLGRVI